MINLNTLSRQEIYHLSQMLIKSMMFKEFCRSYIEIHGVLDVRFIRKKERPRLRIYGNESIIDRLNDLLPAKKKSIQSVTTNTGSTFAIYYQSEVEISQILNWIDGCPKNPNVWKKWGSIMKRF